MKVQLRNPVGCDADAVDKAEGSIWRDRYREVALGSPESLAQGMLSKGFPRNPGELPVSSPPGEVLTAKGNRRRPGQTDEQSYDPIVPVKVGNRRASARSGHGTPWREGENKRTYLPKET